MVFNNCNNFQLHMLFLIENQLQMKVTRCPYSTNVQLKVSFQKHKVGKLQIYLKLEFEQLKVQYVNTFALYRFQVNFHKMIM